MTTSTLPRASRGSASPAATVGLPRLDTGLLGTAAGGAVAVVVGANEWLKLLVNPAATPSALLLGVAVFVLLVTGIATALTVALAVRLVSVASGRSGGFWEKADTLLNDFALWLTIWTIVWGAPFVVAMTLTGVLTRYLLLAPALLIGVAAAIAPLFLFRRLRTGEAWTILAQHWPARRLGAAGMLLGTGFLVLPGRILLEQSYRFDVTGVSGLYKRSDTVPVQVTLAGRIIDHGRLRLQLIGPEPTRKILQTLHFEQAEAGSYTTWLSFAQVPPGAYRIRIRIEPRRSGFEASLQQWPSIFAPPERQFLVRVQ